MREYFMFWFYAGIIFSIFITVASIALLIAVWISWRKEPPRKKGEKTAYVCGIDPVAPTIIGLCSTVFPIVGCFIGKMSDALLVWIFAVISLFFW